MRVIAGTAKHIPLKTPQGMSTRPTTDRIKETLFNMIASEILGARFLDLFSGSGQIGIEALSRGAKSAVFVEKDRTAAAIIRENLKRTRLEGLGEVLCTDVRGALRRLEKSCGSDPEGAFGVIFMDPPYEKGFPEDILHSLADSPLIDEHSLIIIEESLKTDFSFMDKLPFYTVKRKEYKTNTHMFIKKGTDLS